MKKVLITYASLTGNTQFIATEIYDELVKNSDWDIIIKPINEFADAKELGKFDYIIIGASTWGDGDVAPGTEDIFEYIFNSDTDLSKTYLSYFGLGDKKYNEYNTAIVYIEEKITKNLDGKRIGKILQIDGYPNSENINIAVNWASENIELFNKKNT